MLEEDLKCTYEYFSKPCSALKYSEGGHYLAVGYVNNVMVMDSYSMVTLKSFHGHAASIKELCWLSKDKKLLSACYNGNINVWNVITPNPRSDKADKGESKDKTKDLEHYTQNKKIQYHAVAYDPEFDFLVCCCSDMKMRVYTEKGVNMHLDYDCSPVCFHSVCISKKLKVILFGTSNGSVRVYLWPFTTIHKEQ
jgi:WD40 repeat protein